MKAVNIFAIVLIVGAGAIIVSQYIKYQKSISK